MLPCLLQFSTCKIRYISYLYFANEGMVGGYGGWVRLGWGQVWGELGWDGMGCCNMLPGSYSDMLLVIIFFVFLSLCVEPFSPKNQNWRKLSIIKHSDLYYKEMLHLKNIIYPPRDLEKLSGRCGVYMERTFMAFVL